MSEPVADIYETILSRDMIRVVSLLYFVNLVALAFPPPPRFIELHKMQTGERDIPVPAKARPGSHRCGWAGTTRAHLNISANVPETSLDSLQPTCNSSPSQLRQAVHIERHRIGAESHGLLT